ncbi:hypothetical protein [Methanosarcina vacuolata]|uniref:hypothetical protein n=1 Tax=Methanosarcina vacuolata TaxID=2215 RepID=UPI00064F9A20|nr:hypothetical protein [Methanosarcina vacuolata]
MENNEPFEAVINTFKIDVMFNRPIQLSKHKIEADYKPTSMLWVPLISKYLTSLLISIFKICPVIKQKR